MKNPLQQAILKLVEPEIRAANNTALAEIVKYDNKSRTITVKLVNSGLAQEGSELSGPEYLEDITVLNSESFKSEKPKSGEKVYLSFVDNDYSKAIILSIIRMVKSDTNDTGITEIPSRRTQAPPYP